MRKQKEGQKAPKLSDYFPNIPEEDLRFLNTLARKGPNNEYLPEGWTDLEELNERLESLPELEQQILLKNYYLKYAVNYKIATDSFFKMLFPKEERTITSEPEEIVKYFTQRKKE